MQGKKLNEFIDSLYFNPEMDLLRLDSEVKTDIISISAQFEDNIRFDWNRRSWLTAWSDANGGGRHRSEIILGGTARRMER